MLNILTQNYISILKNILHACYYNIKFHKSHKQRLHYNQTFEKNKIHSVTKEETTADCAR